MGAIDTKPLLFLLVAVLGFLLCPRSSGQATPSAGSPPTLKEYRDNGLAYFPSGTFKKPDGSPDDDWADAWAWYLRERGEPPLLGSTEGSPAQSYRLMIIGFPVGRTRIFRLQIEKDGMAKLFIKITPFSETDFLLNREEVISATDVDGFLKRLEQAEFWQLPTREKPKPATTITIDGTYWFLEGTRKGEYHMVHRRNLEWEPSPLTDVGTYLSKDLAKLPY